MEEIRDCRGKLVCMANGQTGVIERLTSKDRIYILLPVGGKFAFETKDAYTMIERINDKVASAELESSGAVRSSIM